jgi:hypothetical protein
VGWPEICALCVGRRIAVMFCCTAPHTPRAHAVASIDLAMPYVRTCVLPPFLFHAVAVAELAWNALLVLFGGGELVWDFLVAPVVNVLNGGEVPSAAASVVGVSTRSATAALNSTASRRGNDR